MKKNVLNVLCGNFLVADGTTEDAEIFGIDVIVAKYKKDGGYKHLNTAPIEKGEYLVVGASINKKKPLYKVRLIYTSMMQSTELNFYKLA